MDQDETCQAGAARLGSRDVCVFTKERKVPQRSLCLLYILSEISLLYNITFLCVFFRCW